MKIVLFDMDGTLTPARKKIEQKMVDVLTKLQKAGFKVCIVSGSDMNYIEEQCYLLFSDINFDHTAVGWYPCNGTKKYIFTNQNKKECCYENNMKEKLGNYEYNDIIRVLLDSQIAIKYSLGTGTMPLSGTFIQYRGSMLNWCPIGRDASEADRIQWVSIDKKNDVRKRMLDRLNSFPVFDKLDIKLGGETSFDIYPKGWDKTFVLNNFKKEDTIYFIGDRCQDDGNDKELYDALKLRDAGDSFKTSGPSKTITIINKDILQHSDQ